MTNDEIKLAIKANRYFDDNKTSFPGATFRIMGQVENYFMVRRKGAMPFVLNHRQFEKRTGISLAYR